MKIRLMGLPDELEAAVEQIGSVLDVVEVSGLYPNRGTSRLARQYLEVRPVPPTTVTVTVERQTRAPSPLRRQALAELAPAAELLE